jgi:hypothetical protein
LTTDNKIKEALTLQLIKEKTVELQLSQQDQEWYMEGHKAQLETEQAFNRLTQLKDKMQDIEQQFNPESISVHTKKISEKDDMLAQMKLLRL